MTMFKSLLNKKIFDHKSYMALIVEFISLRVENVVKGFKLLLPAFSPFPTVFLKASSSFLLKIEDCVVKG